MEQYLGVKLVSAYPAIKGFNLELNKSISADMLEEGYKVVYEDGYTSWSPKDVFEKAYKQIKVLTPHPSFTEGYKQRVVEEAVELQDKIDKLEIFIKDNPIYHSLIDEEQLRLVQQFRAMQYYLTVLVERINNF